MTNTKAVLDNLDLVITILLIFGFADNMRERRQNQLRLRQALEENPGRPDAQEIQETIDKESREIVFFGVILGLTVLYFLIRMGRIARKRWG